MKDVSAHVALPPDVFRALPLMGVPRRAESSANRLPWPEFVRGAPHVNKAGFHVFCNMAGGAPIFPHSAEVVQEFNNSADPRDLYAR
jgi:hypothetical protein